MTGQVRAVLDQMDRRLIAALQEDPRMTMAELGRRIGLSAPSATDRLNRLVAAGVITGWKLQVDPAALGRPLQALVRMRPTPGQLGRLAAAVAELPAVTECHRITGEDCLLVTLHLRSMQDLTRTLDQVQLHGTSVTSIVVDTPVPDRPLPVDGT